MLRLQACPDTSQTLLKYYSKDKYAHPPASMKDPTPSIHSQVPHPFQMRDSYSHSLESPWG